MGFKDWMLRVWQLLNHRPLAVERDGELRRIDRNGGTTRDGTLSYGFSSECGRRSEMEDFFHYHFHRLSRSSRQDVCLFGVFDGHGGSQAAKYVKDNLFARLLSHPDAQSNLPYALVQTFAQIDVEYLEKESEKHCDDGTTAVVAIIQDNILTIANVGDSRAVLSSGGETIAMSDDHKPNRPDERKRIEEAGGIVVWAYSWRVMGVMAVSRSIGDKLYKQYVISDPEIKQHVLNKEDDLLILASDGLWDVLSSREAVALISEVKDAEDAAKALSAEAYNRGSKDNITCIVIRFNCEYRRGSSSRTSK